MFGLLEPALARSGVVSAQLDQVKLRRRPALGKAKGKFGGAQLLRRRRLALQLLAQG